MNEKRNLTDADVAAIVDGLEDRITKKFYLDVGKGVWKLAWSAIVLGLICLAAYGISKGTS